MSEKYFTTYIEPKDAQGRDNVSKFVEYLSTKNWTSLAEYFGDQLKSFTGYSGHDLENKSKLEERLNDLFSGFDSKEENGIFELQYETGTLFDEEAFSYFLLGIGVERTESVYDDSGCGEICYLLNGEFYDCYEDGEWKWVKEPISLDGKNVVFTGKLREGTREEMGSAAEEAGAVVQKEVNKKTHYLIIGDDVGEKKISKAKELGVRVVTEAEFLAVVRDYV
jgi:NAD-dependent DNA ligase